MSGAATDERLMADAARGQRSALETLVRRHAGGLLTFIGRMVGDRHRAEELFQDVFLAVWRKRDQYDYPRPFRPWLYGIALNRCRAAFRTRALATVPSLETADACPTAGGPSPEESAIATETAEKVAAAVLRLPTQQRLVVVLRVWEGLAYADIAETLDRSEATVRSHMHHALAALRADLQPHLG